MTRYIVYILSGLFLVLGFNHFLNQEMQKLRADTGMVTMWSSVEPGHVSLTTAGGQFCNYQQAAKEKGYFPETSEGILGNAFSYRSMSFSKTLKVSPTPTCMRRFSLLEFRYSDKKQNVCSPDVRLDRNSYRYFVFTLGRMLI